MQWGSCSIPDEDDDDGVVIARGTPDLRSTATALAAVPRTKENTPGATPGPDASPDPSPVRLRASDLSTCCFNTASIRDTPICS